MGTIWRDVRYAMRMLGRNPGFTAVAVLTLALGIGANSAMFSIVNGVLLRPLPYPEAERLTMVWTRWNDFGSGSISQPEYFDLLDRSRSFAALGLYRNASINLVDGSGEPERVNGARVTPAVFEALGVTPLFGRTFEPDEWIQGNHRVVLLGYDLWQRRFGGDRNVLGQQITIGTDRSEIIGVMPPGFYFPRRTTQIWPAYGIDREALTSRGNHSNAIVARLADGVSFGQATAELDRIGGFLREEYPNNYPPGMGFTLFARSLLEEWTGDVRPALLTLLGSVGFVLLIACANVANLLLARVAGREKEIAIRSSLGAGRGRIARQILTESLVLSTLGGLGALVVALGAARALRLLDPGNLPRLEQIGLDGRVLLFTAVLVIFTAVAFGLAPALRVTGQNLAQRLREGGRSGAAGLGARARTVLVVAEVAFATVLLIGAGLMIRSMTQMLEVDPGFRSDNVLTTAIALDPGRYGDREQQSEFYRRLVDELESRPEVVAAATITILPLSGYTSDQSLGAEGYSENRGDVADFIQYRTVSPSYFRALGIPVLARTGVHG